ncbi:hypothetical protein FAIPA1_70085 [Frankia sp. AiPs1]
MIRSLTVISIDHEKSQKNMPEGDNPATLTSRLESEHPNRSPRQVARLAFRPDSSD